MNEVSKAERPKRQRFSRRDFVAGLTNAITNIPDVMANSAEPLPVFKWDLQTLKALTAQYEKESTRYSSWKGMMVSRGQSEVRRRQRHESFAIRKKTFKALIFRPLSDFRYSHVCSRHFHQSTQKYPFYSNPGTISLSLRNDFRETPDCPLRFHASCIPQAEIAIPSTPGT